MARRPSSCSQSAMATGTCLKITPSWAQDVRGGASTANGGSLKAASVRFWKLSCGELARRALQVLLFLVSLRAACAKANSPVCKLLRSSKDSSFGEKTRRMKRPCRALAHICLLLLFFLHPFSGSLEVSSSPQHESSSSCTCIFLGAPPNRPFRHCPGCHPLLGGSY